MRLALAASLLVLLLPAGTAAAQDAPPPSCAAPAITAFVLEHDGSVIGENAGPGDPLRTGRSETIEVAATGATRIAVAWPDGSTTSRAVTGEQTRFRHTFTQTGPQRLVATAEGPCGTSSGALSFVVFAPCNQAGDLSVNAEDCDGARGTLSIAQAGLATPATWLSSPCRDVIYPSIPIAPEPVARAAVCVATTGPPSVAGRLPVRSNSVLLIRVGVKARTVRVALGGPNRKRTAYANAPAVPGTARHVFRVRVGRIVDSSRLWIRVRHAGGREAFVAGVRAAQSS